MAKFCGKCGARLDEVTGMCPNCNPAKAPQEEPKKEELKKEQPKKVEYEKAKPKKEGSKKQAKEEKVHKPLSKKAKLFLVIGAVVLVIALAIGALFLFGGEGDYEVSRVDAEEYYQENATVIEKIPAKKSKDVLTESQAFQVFRDRGFDQFPIKTEYAMDGKYHEAIEISKENGTKHPKYYCNYITENGDYWTIVILNGQIMASPVSYNLQAQRKVAVVFAEDTVVTAYDSTSNTFFKIIPKEAMMVVIKVERIDAQTLELLTFEEIDAL